MLSHILWINKCVYENKNEIECSYKTKAKSLTYTKQFCTNERERKLEKKRHLLNELSANYSVCMYIALKMMLRTLLYKAIPCLEVEWCDRFVWSMPLSVHSSEETANNPLKAMYSSILESTPFNDCEQGASFIHYLRLVKHVCHWLCDSNASIRYPE